MQRLALLTLSLACLAAYAQDSGEVAAGAPAQGNRLSRAVAIVHVQASARGPANGMIVRPQDAVGVVVGSDGYVLTQAEAFRSGTRRSNTGTTPIYSDPEGVSVSLDLPDGTQAPAQLLGVDNRTGLALVRLLTAPKDPLTVMPLAVAARPSPEEQVFVLLPRGGIVAGRVQIASAAGITASARRFLPLVEVVLPQPAAGLTGAPVITSQGQFVGVICAQETEASGLARHDIPQNSWFAFAPAVVSRVAEGLSRPPYVVPHRWVGIQCDNALGREGAIVKAVARGGPANRAGLEAGDIIVEAGGRPVRNSPDFGAVVFDAQIGEALPVVVLRGHKRLALFIKVAAQPTLFTQAGNLSIPT